MPGVWCDGCSSNHAPANSLSFSESIAWMRVGFVAFDRPTEIFLDNNCIVNLCEENCKRGLYS